MGLTVKRKYLKTIEILDGEEYPVPRNQQIITSRIIHEITPESEGPVFPRYKVVIVLQCVEFEEDQ